MIKVKDLLKITEGGTHIAIYDGNKGITVFDDMLLADRINVITEVYGEYLVTAINTDKSYPDEFDFEIVIL